MDPDLGDSKSAMNPPQQQGLSSDQRLKLLLLALGVLGILLFYLQHR